MKILVIEDEISLNKSIVSFLRNKGFLCEWAVNFDEAKEKINLYEYDCILVDIELPDGSGLNIVSELKKLRNDAGILIVSALDNLGDKVNGLNTGADDYLTKPFHFEEMLARVNSIIRRKTFHGSPDLVFREIVINPDRHDVVVADKPVALTHKEYDLLLYLVTNRDRVLKKEVIAEHIWGDDIDQSDSFDFLYNHIKNLRKKIANAGGKDYIHAVYGIGYQFSGREPNS
ncbi:MAG TPA: response regulator transcription factor [Bacteroidales bacterium]|nr:response regulator transcription factor [Bacteroidales bacterium]